MVKGKKKKEDSEKSEIVSAVFLGERVIADIENGAKSLYDQGRFGELKEQKIQYSLAEALFLLEKSKIEIKHGNILLNVESFLKKARKLEPNFWIRYVVYRDIRNRGYIIKTALKFGADFRVYDRGIKPGEDHAIWIVFPVHESSTLTWYDFAAKNRVAHSTRKRLLMAIVDNENDVTYYEIAWKRP